MNSSIGHLFCQSFWVALRDCPTLSTSSPESGNFRDSRRCSRDTYPESYNTKHTSIRRWYFSAGNLKNNVEGCGCRAVRHVLSGSLLLFFGRSFPTRVPCNSSTAAERGGKNLHWSKDFYLKPRPRLSYICHIHSKAVVERLFSYFIYYLITMVVLLVAILLLISCYLITTWLD